MSALVRLTSATLVAICLPALVYAQASSINGVVKDTSGAVLPGVTVEAASPALIEKVRSAVTDRSGHYDFENLRPGTYSLTFTLTGFSTVRREGIELTGSFTATVNADMKVGAVVGTIVLRDEAPVVDVVNAKQLETEQAAIVAVAERAAVAAITFRQGDAAGFSRARVDFTSDGWVDFTKRMQGFLDATGAPTFTSSFTPSRSASVLSEHDGVVHFRVPGSLVQSNALGRTTYRAAIEVYAGGSPVRIERLEQITCVGASTACQ